MPSVKVRSFTGGSIRSGRKLPRAESLLRSTPGDDLRMLRGETVQKILVISLAGIGDTVLATPLMHELRAQFPAAQLDVFVMQGAGARDLLLGNPHISNLHFHNMLQSGAMTNIGFLSKLRRERYDASFNTYPQSRIEYRAVARFIGARERLSHIYDNPSPLDRVLMNR